MGGEAAPRPRAAPGILDAQMLRLRVGNLALAGAIAIAWCAGAGSACSLLVDRASAQCSSSSDCVGRFGAGSTCGADGICVTPAASDAGDGGDATPFEASLGDAPALPCQTTQDCTPLDPSAICRKSDGACVSVITQECQKTIGQFSSDDTILVGALLPSDTDVTYGHLGASIESALRLAAADFSGDLPPLTDGGHRRPIAIVLCNEEQGVDKATAHLRDDLRVPIILGTAFSASTLQVAADLADAGRTLVMAPAAGSDLSAVVDGGLVWRTMPPDATQAAAIDALVAFLEPTIEDGDAGAGGTDAGGDAAGPKMRVAVVHQADVYGNELEAAVTQGLRFNGLAAGDPNNDAYFIDVDYGNPDQPGPNQDGLYADAVTAVTNASKLPDVIVLLGYTHAVQRVLTGIESIWPGGKRPQYVLSNGLETPDLLDVVATATTTSLRTRILGTSPGEDPSVDPVTNAFDVRFRLFVDGGAFPESYATANAYDAFYALAYGVAGARNSDLVGLDVVRAMRTVLVTTPPPEGGTPDAAPIAVGSDGIPAALAAIQAGQKIALQGVSGPLLFDVSSGSGAVTADVQVWCITAASGTPQIARSGLAWDTAQGTLVGSAIDPACTH
jgi:ABC-type branched-subunit amino acid transport system substrate-binding protein